MFKRLLASIALTASAFAITPGADADVFVRGYFRSGGTYVQPHYRSDPDGNFYNNWSTYPNVNPYTGRVGTRRTPSHSYQYYHYPSYQRYWGTDSSSDLFYLGR